MTRVCKFNKPCILHSDTLLHFQTPVQSTDLYVTLPLAQSVFLQTFSASG